MESKTRFANILFDETFKIVMGAPGNDPLLIKIIELLLPGKQIRTLQRLDKENHGFVFSDKNTTFDLFCTSGTGEQFIVEMQFAEQETYRERMLFYATYPIRAQMDARIRAVEQDPEHPKCKMDYALHPVYVLSILNFQLPHKSDEALEDGLVSRYAIRNDGNGELMTEALHFVYLELGRLGPGQGEWEQCTTPVEQLAYSLKYMHLLDRRPKGFSDEFQRMLYKAAELACMTQKTRREYDKTMTTKIDIIEQREFARKQGYEEGKEQGYGECYGEGYGDGYGEGYGEGIRKIAGKMLSSGMLPEQVRAYTGLSEEELNAL